MAAPSAASGWGCVVLFPPHWVLIHDQPDLLQSLYIRSQLGAEQHTKADTTDGLRSEFSGWRMNIWASNTEPFLRLNIESRDAARLVQSCIDELEVLIARQSSLCSLDFIKDRHVSVVKGSSKVLMIDAFSTLHVGNGALIDNTYKLCRQYLGEKIDILSIDARTNKGRFPVVLDDIFTGYGGSFLNKLSYALAITLFVMIECLNVIVFNGRVRVPWKGRYALMLGALDRSDICVSLSGETINDHYRPHMYLRLLTYYLAVLKGKKFVVFPQSIGPVFRPLSKWLLRKTLGRAHAIIARDRESYALAKQLWGGCKVEILFSPDVATTQESTAKPLPVANEGKKVIGLTVSDIPRDEMGYQGDYLSDLLEGIAVALDKDAYQILMMPSNYRHNEVSQDYRVCLEAKEILQEKGFDVAILRNEIIHPDIYQGMQKSLFAFISTRMHVGILATSAGVPTLMINTQHKIRSYMSLMEMDDFVLELSSLTDVAEKVSALLDQNIILREKLVANNKRLREQVGVAMSSLAESL